MGKLRRVGFFNDRNVCRQGLLWKCHQNSWYSQKHNLRHRSNLSKWFLEGSFQVTGDTTPPFNAYHLESDDQSNVVNKSLQQYLRCFVMDAPFKWTSFLHLAELWYNTMTHSLTGLMLSEATFRHSCAISWLWHLRLPRIVFVWKKLMLIWKRWQTNIGGTSWVSLMISSS